MPIYEYECAGCHHKFDLLQKMSDTRVRKCPKCGQDKVARLVSAAGFQLKGTGWYATDYKNKGTAPKHSSHGSSESSTSDKKESSTKKGETE